MPRAPIQNRTLFYTKLRDGTFRLLDWNLVNHATLGAMMEPRQVRYIDDTKVVNVDVYDVNFTHIKEYNEDKMWSELGTAGWLLPRDLTV